MPTENRSSNTEMVSVPAAPYPNRLCHIDYTAHPYRCGCLQGDEEAQRRYDEHCRNASAAQRAPDCATCNDEGAVGNILDMVPCPDCAAASPAGADDLSDLATWKRRAIEAESKLRTYDPQILDLGQREVAALLAEPRPSEVVLMKCRLCDELQDQLGEAKGEYDRSANKVAALSDQQAETRKLLTWLCNDIDSGMTSTWNAKLQSHLDGLPSSK